jgi:hypothetical protein
LGGGTTLENLASLKYDFFMLFGLLNADILKNYSF